MERMHRSTRSSHATTGGPALGIWWDAGKLGLPNVQVVLARSKDHSGYRDSGKLHANEWGKIQKAFPELLGMQYIDIPRGRVVHSKGRFIVQMGHQSVNVGELREKIAKAFRLPGENTVFVHDLEYDLRRHIPMPFNRWLKKQMDRSDEVGAFARLSLAGDAASALTSALNDPDTLERACEDLLRDVRGSDLARTALAIWRAGELFHLKE